MICGGSENERGTGGGSENERRIGNVKQQPDSAVSFWTIDHESVIGKTGLFYGVRKSESEMRIVCVCVCEPESVTGNVNVYSDVKDGLRSENRPHRARTCRGDLRKLFPWQN